MRTLPLTDPGVPDLRSPARFLWWIARGQWVTLLVGVCFGVAWMLAQALVPYAIGRGLDAGVAALDAAAAVRWSLVVLGLGLLQAGAGVMRHRVAVSNWLQASFRTAQLIAHHTARTGPALPAQVTTGEIASTVSHDAMRMGGAFDVSARFSGAIVSYVLVAVILLNRSLTLGLLVLVGVPVLLVAIGPILRPLQRRQAAQREAVGRLTALGADTVAGLRVLRGIGGEGVFLGRYRERSEHVRRAGVEVAGTQATLDAAQVLLPGVFVVALTWLGARLALTGQISVGELVAFYGYAFFLVVPLRTATEAADKLTRAYVGAQRVIAVLRVDRDVVGPAVPGTEPPVGSVLVDDASGIVVRPGRLTAVVSAEPQETAALADRLGRFVDDRGVALGGSRLADLSLDAVRRRVLVSEAESRLFTGTLRHELDPWGLADDERLLGALHTASAEDVLEALPAGLDSAVEERGRSFSGGQRQRVVLTRALVADPEVLVLVEPTSAVDAHTEARIAERLHTARAGRTTVVTSASPLVLDRADLVVWMEGGRAVAEGRHRDLLARVPAYRDTVTRGPVTPPGVPAQDRPTGVPR